VAVTSAGPYASLHLTLDRYPCQHPTTQFFAGRMPFLLPNQQRQSTEGNILRIPNTIRQQQQLFDGPLSRTTRVSQYQKTHSPTHHPDYHPIFISFFHLLRSIASSLFKLCALQSFCTTSLHVLFGLPLGLEPPPHIPYISSPN